MPRNRSNFPNLDLLVFEIAVEIRLNVDDGVGGLETVDPVKEIEADAEGDIERLGCGLIIEDPKFEVFFSEERRGCASRLEDDEGGRDIFAVRVLGGSLFSRRD